jgi:cytochrome c oxidase assembly factor CtaG
MPINISHPWFVQWNLDPLAIALILILIAGYLISNHLLALEHLQQPDSSTQAWMPRITFYLAIVILFIVLISPFAILAHILFSGHMLQHLLISFGVAPLLAITLSAGIMQFLLRWRPLAAAWKWLTMPLIASIVFNANIWLWHAPPLIDAMMYNPLLHLFVQVLYIITGILFWWPLLGIPAPTVFPLNLAGKMIYILLSDMPMVLLGAGLSFMPSLYTSYQTMTPILGISPGLDQQIAGLTMWVPGGIYLIVIASILFLRWMISLEVKQKAEDERLAAQYEEDDDFVESR